MNFRSVSVISPGFYIGEASYEPCQARPILKVCETADNNGNTGPATKMSHVDAILESEVLQDIDLLSFAKS